MSDGNLAGILIMAFCCFGCAILFVGIGIWAWHSGKPINFWSGTKVDPEKVSDTPGYNRANAVMWIIYSIPYWIAGIFSCLEPYDQRMMIISAVVLGIACVPGVFFLIFAYHRIEKKYIIR